MNVLYVLFNLTILFNQYSYSRLIITNHSRKYYFA